MRVRRRADDVRGGALFEFTAKGAFQLRAAARHVLRSVSELPLSSVAVVDGLDVVGVWVEGVGRVVRRVVSRS